MGGRGPDRAIRRIRKRHGAKLLEESDRADVHRVGGLAVISMSDLSMILIVKFQFQPGVAGAHGYCKQAIVMSM